MDKLYNYNASVTPNSSINEEIQSHLDDILDCIDNINKYELNNRVKFNISEIENEVYNIKNILNN